MFDRSNLWHSAPIGLFVISLDMRIIDANRFLLDLLGYTEGEITNAIELLHPDFVGKAWSRVAQLWDSEQTQIHETERIKTKAGEYMWFYCTLVAQMNQGQRIIYGVSVSVNKLDEIMDSVEEKRSWMDSFRAPVARAVIAARGAAAAAVNGVSSAAQSAQEVPRKAATSIYNGVSSAAQYLVRPRSPRAMITAAQGRQSFTPKQETVDSEDELRALLD